MSTITESILDSTKQVLGLESTDTDFNVDVLMHINSTLAELNQLGIGPENGLMILDSSAVWSDLLGDDLLLNNVKTFVYLRVRMYFDPPTTSFHLAAMEKQIQELTYRINVHREEKVHPLVLVTVEEDE